MSTLAATPARSSASCKTACTAVRASTHAFLLDTKHGHRLIGMSGPCLHPYGVVERGCCCSDCTCTACRRQNFDSEQSRTFSSCAGTAEISGLLLKKAYLQQWHGVMTQALHDARAELAATASAARLQVCRTSAPLRMRTIP